MELNAAFQWKCQPIAESLLENYLAEAAAQNSLIGKLSDDLKKQTSTRLFDWIDHFILGSTPALEKELTAAGYVNENPLAKKIIYHHPGAQLPRVIVETSKQPVVGIALNVDAIAEFLMARGINAPIIGSPYSAYRESVVCTENGISLLAIERRGSTSLMPDQQNAEYLTKYVKSREKWLTRSRGILSDDEELQNAKALAEEIVGMLGVHSAACLVLECERIYWQARNTAGQIQKNRQDRLGMGWGNHDHHTFRSSRHHFHKLVKLFEILGFQCRERFYAGEEAGWGAQVMENPSCRLVLFLDVDLAPNEIEIDFAHQELPPLNSLGTVGLWCALHGDSILKAGMHHLEAQFMFEDLKTDLATLGVGMMDPFSSFPYLKQAFTKGEMWRVDPGRVHALLSAGMITPAQSQKFLGEGAIGSHLENLQRREGYKGFNQKNVSMIIKETDPRNVAY